jgi:tryptophan-rich sensory protein
MFKEKPRTEDYLRRQRNHVWLTLVIGWFLFSIFLLTLFSETGGLIAIVLLFGISIARAVIFRKLECNAKVVGSEPEEPEGRSDAEHSRKP